MSERLALILGTVVSVLNFSQSLPASSIKDVCDDMKSKDPRYEERPCDSISLPLCARKLKT